MRTTLRQILDVPPAVKKDKVKFRNSFDDQRNLSVLTGSAVDIDKEIEITLEPMDVVVLEGVCSAGGRKKDKAETDTDEDDEKPAKKKKKGQKKKKSRK